jgi:hypothetical protein
MRSRENQLVVEQAIEKNEAVTSAIVVPEEKSRLSRMLEEQDGRSVVPTCTRSNRRLQME